MRGQPLESGVLLVDKPSGITSHDAVDRVRRALGVRKVGHAGTLDPAATGLLLIGVGRATRLLRFLGDLPKVYEGTGVLGVETTTLDADGDMVRESPVDVTESALREAMASFVGPIEQVPPAYSAVKVGGEKLYRAARAGRTVEAAPRSVEVFSFDLIEFTPPRFDFLTRCSAGTYVRSLVADVGARLGCGAHLAGLRRTAIGPFLVEEAAGPDEPGPLFPLERAVEHLPALTLQEEEARAASHGQCLGPTGIAGPFRAIGPEGGLIGIYRDTGAKSCPDVILAPST
ncbi:MAG TPA: tRNA pseudouridine(55) synthase TruB [Actinomycetota bacterium]|nr:tRNA pseudouridine(55) synthase TruB [Actinomycetota bacterium]